MEKELKKQWHAELWNKGDKICEKFKNDFTQHLQNVEKIVSERDEFLDLKEKEANEKSKALDKREKNLNAREAEMVEKLDMLETEKRILEDDRTKHNYEKEKWKIEEEALFTKYRIKESVIKLKVGEKIFETYKSTLTKDPNSMLAIRFSGRHDPVTVDGAHFFDRDPTYFGYILNYLRDESITAEILPRSTDELYKILKEADYYQLSGLKQFIEKIIWQSNNPEEASKKPRKMDTMTRKMREGTLEALRTFAMENEPCEQKVNELIEELRKLKQDVSTYFRATRRENWKVEIEKLYDLIQQSFPREMLIDPVVIKKVVTSLRSFGQATGTSTQVEELCGQLQNILPKCLKDSPEPARHTSSYPLIPFPDYGKPALKSEDLKQLQTKIRAINFNQIKCNTAANMLWEICQLRSMVE